MEKTENLCFPVKKKCSANKFRKLLNQKHLCNCLICGRFEPRRVILSDFKADFPFIHFVQAII